MILERVDDLPDGSVRVYLRIEEEEDGTKAELQTLAESNPSELWKRPLNTFRTDEGLKLQNAQLAGREYRVTILDSEDAIPEPETAPAATSEKYFQSYDDIEIHRLMLSDQPRTERYIQAIQQSGLEGQTVLDVGAGSGILALVASRSGAKVVHAVEAAPKLAQLLALTAEENGCNITAHGCRVEDLDLDGKVDVIVSEWMGFYLLHESMLDSVLSARDRFLKPGGTLIPNKARIFVAPVSTPVIYEERVSSWDNVYGFQMKALKEMAQESLIASPLCQVIEEEALLAEPQEFQSLDLHSVTSEDLNYLMKEFEFTIARDAKLHGFCCFFEVDMCEGIVLSTSPKSPPTHWKQSLFMFGSEYDVQQESTIKCCIEMCRSGLDARNYSIIVSMD